MIPKGIVTTGWPAVKARGAELGFTYDPWQDGAGRITFGKRANGKYAATVGGIVWSIPRQIGKTFSVGSWLMVLCILFPGLKVVWTAHRLRTSTMTFRSMQAMAKRPKLWPHIDHIRTANGEQEIGFTNGSVILFGAREQGFGRGFEEVDVEVFDEAQILTEKALDDMVPAANQARHPHGALLFFIGTPPKPTDPGEAFTIRRTKALSGKSKDMLYIEFSADPDAKPDDRKQWSKANPSYPKRTPLESMLRMRENLLSDEAWMREALGVWDDPELNASDINPIAWKLCAKPKAVVNGSRALGLDVTLDQSWAAISGAGMASGVMHLETVSHRKGTGWVVEAAVELQAKHPNVALVVDERSPAASLIPDLEQAGVLLVKANTSHVTDGCAWMFTAITDGNVTHADDEMTQAVAATKKRPVNDRFAWGRKQSAADISTFNAATLAAWSVVLDDLPSDYDPLASLGANIRGA